MKRKSWKSIIRQTTKKQEIKILKKADPDTIDHYHYLNMDKINRCA